MPQDPYAGIAKPVAQADPYASIAVKPSPAPQPTTPPNFPNPSTWDVLTQDRDKTDAEAMSYKGVPGVVGATISGLDKYGNALSSGLGSMWDAAKSALTPDGPKTAEERVAEAQETNPIPKVINAAQNLGSQTKALYKDPPTYEQTLAGLGDRAAQGGPQATLARA